MNASINRGPNRCTFNEGNCGGIARRKSKQTFRYYRQTSFMAGQTATREHERGNDKLRRVARDITVIPWQAGGGPVERHWSNPNARRLIYAATPFRTATLKTLTAFNFRWPSILFSLVWTTFSRTRYPAPLRHAPHASAKEITCPLLPSRQICRLLSHRPLAPPSPVRSTFAIARSPRNVLKSRSSTILPDDGQKESLGKFHR